MRRPTAAIAAGAIVLVLAGAGSVAAQPPPDPPVREEPRTVLQAPDLEPHLLENGVESLEVVPGEHSFKDPFSGGLFPTTIQVNPVGGPAFRLRALGSGGRKKLFWKIYGAALGFLLMAVTIVGTLVALRSLRREVVGTSA